MQELRSLTPRMMLQESRTVIYRPVTHLFSRTGQSRCAWMLDRDRRCGSFAAAAGPELPSILRMFAEARVKT